jgi:branched-chain amino acid aminotransferase
MTDIALQFKQPLKAAAYNFHEVRFGYDPTDHMFIAEYKNQGWQNARIEPFHPLSMSPFAACLHYGQTVFEGMKAYRHSDDTVSVFRPDKHRERLNKSLVRMGMPPVPEDLFRDALHTLVALDKQWVSALPGYSLYIRPFVIASEARIGARAASEFVFMIVCSPMAKYYDKPLRVKVETQFVRAVEGGVGAAKCGGNYGGAFYPAMLAQEQGFDQVLWTDGKHHQFIEESGTMNVMFLLDDVLVTPPLNGTILDGVTRDSVLTLAKDAGVPVEERPISYQELLQHLEAGNKVEAFGVGTAASLTPIEAIHIEGTDYFPYVSADALMFRFRERLDAIRRGLAADEHQWNYLIAE